MKYSTSVSSSQAATAVIKMLRLESGSNKRDYHDRQRGAAVGTAKGRGGGETSPRFSISQSIRMVAL